MPFEELNWLHAASMEPQVAARPPTSTIQLGYLMAVFVGTVGEAARMLYSPSQLLEGSTGRKKWQGLCGAVIVERSAQW